MIRLRLWQGIPKRWTPSRALHGLRLLDYARSKTHPAEMARIPPAAYLLQARGGFRYNHKHENELEIATILVALFRADASDTQALKELKNIEERIMGFNLGDEQTAWRQGTLGPYLHNLLNGSEYDKETLKTWAECFLAPTVSQALEIMKGGKWPQFLLLYTFNRRCRSKQEAYDLIRLYEKYLETMDLQYQLEFTFLALELAFKHVVEMIPPICKMFVRYGLPETRTPKTMNELLWRMSHFGTAISVADAEVVMAGHRVIIKDMGSSALDLKGRVALAYLTLDDPSLARQLVDAPVKIANGRGMAYQYGRQCIHILTAPTAAEALTLFYEMGPTNHTPFIWGVLTMALRSKKLLTPDLANKLWSYIVTNKARIGALALQHLLQAAQPFEKKVQMLDHALAAGFKITPGLAASLLNVESRQELVEALKVVEQYKLQHNPRVVSALLSAQARYDSEGVWKTYSAIENPSAGELSDLCSAAWNSTLLWEGLYAPQRAVAEVRKHVRVDPEDVLRLYPTDQLVYAYVFMLGRARYHMELEEVLPWLDSLGLVPQKRTLCALIHFSPNGSLLLSFGEQAKGPWPSKEDFSEYVHDLEASKHSSG